jgi:hypothetical protein
MDVFDRGARSRVNAMFEATVDLDSQVNELMLSLAEIRETLSRLTALYPTSLS